MTAFSRIALSRFRVALVVAAIASGGVLASLAPADTVPPTPTIELQNAVHFLTPAGEDLVVAPGTYEVDAAKEGLRLTPTGGKEAEAVLVQAQALPHGESLTAPKVDVRPAGEDQYRVALLLPDGTGLEAVGSYSGVRTRGYGGGKNTYYGTAALGNSAGGGSASGSQSYTNTTGSGNSAFGNYALSRDSTGSANTSVGDFALLYNTTGSWNTAVGSEALFANTTSWNTAMGYQALRANTTGGYNTAMGSLALNLNSTGGYNAAVGADALRANSTGASNSAVGVSALGANTTGNGNTATGFEALKANTTASYNTAMGIWALTTNTTGENNTAMGTQALWTNTTGGSNTATGTEALKINITGASNTAMGRQALSNNTIGSGNLALGAGAGINQTVGSNNIYLSHRGIEKEAGTIRFGTPGTQTRAFLAGVAGVPVSGSVVQVDANGQLGIQPSSRRYKEAIENMGTASQGLLHLRPVTFRYTPEVAAGERRREYGLIAEEVAEVYPELVGHNAEGQIVTVQYHALIPMLLNELQQQHRVSEEQHRQLEALMARVAELEAK